jgi:hypothetical protein
MRLSAAVLTAVLGVASCATKEVTLNFSDAASDASDGGRDVVDAAAEPRHFPVPFCLPFVDSATGESCMTCYDEWGVELSRACKPPPPRCMARDDASLTRCIYCDDAPGVPRACLKCDQLPTDAGQCATCQWSDSGTACRRCADASGTLDYVGCDALRTDLGQP